MVGSDARRRILFVDDDPVLLQFYSMIMEREAVRWDTSTVSDPKQALVLLSQNRFDVLVSDYRMPGCDGIQFMREVSERYPGAARIMLSGIQDQEEVARCLGVTHQFLAKPFKLKQFEATLAQVGELSAFLDEPRLRSIVSSLKSLPSVPSLYLEMMREINREDSSLEALGEIVAKDPGMTAKLLHFANAASVARAHRVSNPLEAIQHLGIANVHSVVLSAHVFSSFEQSQFKGLSIQVLWDHAVQTAAVARSILAGERAAPELCDSAYTAGLLHDIGKLVLAQSFPDQWQEALRVAAESKVSPEDAEGTVLGATHPGVGAYLLGLWGLPGPLVEAVAFHHAPSRSEQRALGPLAAVHAANAFLHEDSPTPAGPARLDLEYLRGVGVADRLDRWRTYARKSK